MNTNTITIDEIRKLYNRVSRKTEFIARLSNALDRSPLTIRQHWFGQFYSIPVEHREKVVELVNETIEGQTAKTSA